MKAVLSRFWKDECGTSAVEYTVFVAFLAVGLIVALITLEGSFSGFYNESATYMDAKPE